MVSAPAARSGNWPRPTAWKAVLLVAGYLVLFTAVSQVAGWLFRDLVDTDDLLGSAGGILLLTLPIGLAGLALVLFAARQGWWAEIFGRQRVEGRRWMWIGPGLVVLAIVAHLAGVDWGHWGAGQLLAMVLLGACVGFTEEIATRGLAVKIIRDAGHGEKFVAFLSSLLFSLMHLVNLISGMTLTTVASTVVYTFAFGMCMYLTMRVTGTIWAAIVLHGLTDPSTFLATGGIDESVIIQDSGATMLGALLTVVLIAFGFVSVLFVKGVTTREG